MDATEALAKLDAAARRRRRTEKTHDAATLAEIKAMFEARDAGVRPTDIVEHASFTGSYVRRVFRDRAEWEDKIRDAESPATR